MIDEKKNNLSDLLNTFICGKCENILQLLPDECIDLIITSPPYANQRFYGSDESTINPDNYVEWFLPKAEELYRVLKPTGSFVLNINDKVVKGKQQLYVFELVLKLSKDIGFNLVRDYIWHNVSTPPNIFSSGKYGRTKKSHEYCFWFSKGDNWTFNMDPIRKPYSKDMLKYLSGNGKGNRQENTRPSTHSFNCKKKWNDNGGSDPGSVLQIANTKSNDEFLKLCKSKGIMHPARFPEKLVEFFVLAGSNETDIVLDPFCGSGTTAIVSEKYNRQWIGIDSNRNYCDLAYERLKMEFPTAFQNLDLIIEPEELQIMNEI